MEGRGTEVTRTADRRDELSEWLAGQGMSYTTTHKGYDMRLEAVESREDSTDYVWEVEVNIPPHGWQNVHTGISGQTLDEVVEVMKEEIDQWDPVE